MNSLTFNPQQTGLTNNQMQTIKSFYAGLQQILHFEEGLSNREVNRLMRLSRQNLLFVDDSIDAIEQLPELCPRFLDPVLVEKEADYFHQLRFLEQMHEQAGAALKDMRLILGDKCFRSGLLIYDSVKSASKAGYPKARPIYEQMRKRFDAAPTAQPEDSEAPADESMDNEVIVEDVTPEPPSEAA